MIAKRALACSPDYFIREPDPEKMRWAEWGVEDDSGRQSGREEEGGSPHWEAQIHALGDHEVPSASQHGDEKWGGKNNGAFLPEAGPDFQTR